MWYENFSLKILFFFKNIIPEIILNKLILINSQKKVDRLEITSTIGCAMMCDYCPQTLINSERRKKNLNRKLDFNDFKKFMEKVSNKTQIHWSGYSEPLAHENFPDFANYLKENNYKQIISTTMFGRRNAERFMSEFNGFKSVTFHLPDDKNLMKLKIKDEYLKNLEKAIIFQASYIKNELYFLVFGDNFHPEIEKLLKNLIKKKNNF